MKLLYDGVRGRTNILKAGISSTTKIKCHGDCSLPFFNMGRLSLMVTVDKYVFGLGQRFMCEIVLQIKHLLKIHGIDNANIFPQGAEVVYI